MSDERPQPSERHIIIYEETEIVVIRRRPEPEPEPPDDGELLRRLRAYNDRPCDPEQVARIDREAAARDRWEFIVNSACWAGFVAIIAATMGVVYLVLLAVHYFTGK